MAVSIGELLSSPRVTGLAIGVFDGVHLGHRAILAHAFAGFGPGETAALTFEPHPLAVIAPEKAPPRLTTEAQREALLHAANAGAVYTLRFDEALRQHSAETFMAELSHLFPALQRIAFGPNWRFGRGRSGNASLLAAYGAAHGFVTDLVPAVEHEGKPVSSSRIREAISTRDFAGATAMLGRGYEVVGTVVAGDGRGAGIGFPTANIGGIAQLLPPPGVYACTAQVNGITHRAVANYGSKPTFGPDGKPVLEAHLLDFSGNLYGATLTVGAFRFLREERKFESVAGLKAQIAADVRSALRI